MGDSVEPQPDLVDTEPTPEQVDNSNPLTRDAVAALTDAVDTLILDSLGGFDV